MKDAVKVVLVIAAAMLAIALFAAYFGALDFGLSSYFMPKQEALRNKTFHQSQAFNDSMARDLDTFRMQYADPKETDTQKSIIRSMIQHQYAGYDASKLPADLQQFLAQMREPQ